MPMPALQVPSRNQPTRPHSELHIEWVTRKAITHFHPRQLARISSPLRRAIIHLSFWNLHGLNLSTPLSPASLASPECFKNFLTVLYKRCAVWRIWRILFCIGRCFLFTAPHQTSGWLASVSILLCVQLDIDISGEAIYSAPPLQPEFRPDRETASAYDPTEEVFSRLYGGERPARKAHGGSIVPSSLHRWAGRGFARIPGCHQCARSFAYYNSTPAREVSLSLRAS